MYFSLKIILINYFINNSFTLYYQIYSVMKSKIDQSNMKRIVSFKLIEYDMNIIIFKRIKSNLYLAIHLNPY